MSSSARARSSPATLPSPASTRATLRASSASYSLMPAERPLLLLPLFLPNVEVTFRGWMGGAIYVQNLAAVLSELAESERPRIAILTDGGLDAALPRTLFN